MKSLIKSIVLLLIVFIFYSLFQQQQPLKSETVEFLACTDGDTAHFRIDGKDETVRFIAIDTPETKHPDKGLEPFGQEASDFTCNALQAASAIQLEYEPLNVTDKYGRIVAWVLLEGELLQEQLVEQGYAKVAYLYGDYKYTHQLEAAESIAKEEQLRIWSLE